MTARHMPGSIPNLKQTRHRQLAERSRKNLGTGSNIVLIVAGRKGKEGGACEARRDETTRVETEEKRTGRETGDEERRMEEIRKGYEREKERKEEHVPVKPRHINHAASRRVRGAKREKRETGPKKFKDNRYRQKPKKGPSESSPDKKDIKTKLQRSQDRLQAQSAGEGGGEAVDQTTTTQ
ncbi:hypothetical protein FISHEDRAFT_55827 [Fistulina hepatica ATCC 64428]|uniref:Uncharacterized protein n=1 Tax=Fistulina hepatica ATCC 64428 TaxID=1128425 RepID=A0A0D7ALX1_9AGAR|nr:hypothetical protein FISHEDRAFT_55827 [Fistulina hepatica ATCC 64428]